MFWLKKAKKALKTLKFIKELPKRTAAMKAQLPASVANGVLDELRARIPSTSDWDEYRSGLEVVAVGSKKSGLAAIRLPNNPSSSATKKIDPPRTLIYIRAHRRLTRIPPTIQILAKYSPWTADTLPFSPPKKDAIMVSRKTSKQVAMRVAAKRRQDRPFWSRELQKAGRREIKKNDRMKPSSTATPLPDYAYQAIRLEFGLGIRSTPHWRPAITSIRRSPSQIWKKDPVLLEYLDPKFRGWRGHRTKVQGTISKAEAKKFAPFQRRLGL